jgi:putative transposase
MQRTNTIQLKPSKAQKKILKELILLSSSVYNQTNYIIRQQFFNKDKISSFFTLQQQMQNNEDYQMLGRSYALPRIQIYAETNSARFKLIKSRTQKYVNLPKYYKNRKTNTTLPSYLVFDGCQYSIKNKYVIIPLSRQMRKKHKVGKQFKIKYNGILKWKGLQKRGQIHFRDNQFYMHQAVELKDTNQKQSKTKAGLDLGIKRIFGIYINNGFDKVIGINKFYKQWKHYTSLISQEQTKLAKINRRTSNKLQRLFKLRSKWQNNLYNNLTAKLFRILRRNRVSGLVVGDIKNIRDSKSKGRKVNQMINNYWSFDLLLRKIQNKSEEFGVELLKETEEYTSRTCPICGDNDKQNCKDRIFICSFCGYTDHRDIVGAKNIFIKSRYGSSGSILRSETAPLEVVA